MHMLKLIVGKKGTGKTKQLISMVNDAVNVSNGKIVCIEKGNKLTYDINHGARLLNTDSYSISGFDAFYGFLAGIAASDFDVKEVYVDSLLKIAVNDPAALTDFFSKIDALGTQYDICFTFTVSMETAELPEKLKGFII